MPFYKRSIDGAKNRWRSNLSRSMKRLALHNRCPQCGRKGALKRLRINAHTSMRVCRWADCLAEICP